ncbi:uncharacterized protein EV154DRAFT_570765 [Mucor mucedo]|uniref:uncharacterized protein n=1 Tax=Mucor mucedo TaxID=29922 RepID=UPI00221F0B91|nr:uncharacterized protein EV154DRAFT_570765 [Mucor mucedo]KAI7870907.1 hypothetical protein EV154DRAFT_570765 [Mucor mucedo]
MSHSDKDQPDLELIHDGLNFDGKQLVNDDDNTSVMSNSCDNDSDESDFEDQSEAIATAPKQNHGWTTALDQPGLSRENGKGLKGHWRVVSTLVSKFFVVIAAIKRRDASVKVACDEMGNYFKHLERKNEKSELKRRARKIKAKRQKALNSKEATSSAPRVHADTVNTIVFHLPYYQKYEKATQKKTREEVDNISLVNLIQEAIRAEMNRAATQLDQKFEQQKMEIEEKFRNQMAALLERCFNPMEERLRDDVAINVYTGTGGAVNTETLVEKFGEIEKKKKDTNPSLTTAIPNQIRKLKDQDQFNVKSQFCKGNNPNIADIVGARILSNMRREWKNSGKANPVLTEEEKREEARKAEEKKAKFENNIVTLDQVNRFIVLKYMSEEETDNDSNKLGMFDSNNKMSLYAKKPTYRSNK